MTDGCTLEELSHSASDRDPELAPYAMDWPAFVDAMRDMSAHVGPFLAAPTPEVRAEASACLAALAAVPGASDPPAERSRLIAAAADERDPTTRAQLIHDAGRLRRRSPPSSPSSVSAPRRTPSTATGAGILTYVFAGARPRDELTAPQRRVLAAVVSEPQL